jgi:superoxide reductase
VGKEVAHPNTTAHHIRWMQLFFQPKKDKFTYQVGNFGFSAHGEHVDASDHGPVYTQYAITKFLKVSKPGILHAISLCNIHGLWESIKAIDVIYP